MQAALFRLFLWAMLAAVSAGSLWGAEWPNFRGSRYDGIAVDHSLAEASALRFRLLWRRELGSGYSSVTTQDGRGYTMASIGDSDYLVCFDLDTGRDLFRYRINARYLGRSGSHDGPTSTPAADAEAVYALGPRGDLIALNNRDGQLLWSRSLPDDFQAHVPIYGFSTSPLVVGDLLVVQTGGPDGEAVAALNKKDGSVIWKAGTGKVEAQIPLVADLAGRRQILATAASKIFGLDIETGTILWEADQSEKLGYEQITLAGPEHLLLTHDGGSVYYRIHSTEGRISLQELWENREFRANGLNPRIPVYLNGHFYAHTGPFLSCIEADTGRRAWRSRPPGGQSLISVADRLMMVGSEGHLVAVSAQPEAYREQASLKVFEQHRIYTPPSFSDGRLFVRDLTHLAAVEVRPTDNVPLVADGRNAAGRRPQWIAQVEDAQDKRRAVEELLRRPGGFPVVEDGWAHFVFQGDVADLAIRSDLTGYWPEIPMRRLEGTDLFHASFPTQGAQRFQYRFQVFDEDRLDPLNPRRVETADGRFSVWQSEDWNAPDFLTRSPSQPGRLDEVEVVSRRNGRSYAMSVYTPARAVGGAESLPLVLVAQGSDAVEKGHWVTALDNLYQNEALPDMIVAFIKLPESAWYTASLQRLEQILLEDYLPYLRQSYPLADDPDRRAIVAQGNSATNMLWLAAMTPGLSSRIALQSPYMYRDYRSRHWPEILRSEHLKQVRLGWGSHDGRNPAEDVDVARDAAALADRLRSAGFRVDAAESRGGWGWALWSSQLRDVLIGLFQE